MGLSPASPLSEERAFKANLRRRTHHQNRWEGDDAGPEEAPGDPVDIATRVEKPSEEAIGAESKKGDGLLSLTASRPLR